MALILGGLAGCGGSAATTPVVTGPETLTIRTSLSEAEMQSAQSELIEIYSPIEYTSLTLIPTSGAAVYDGYLSGTLANSDDGLTNTVIGDMSLVVGFTSSSVTISGSASNFRDEDDVVMAGSLTFSDGSLDRSGDPNSDVTLTLAANGTLTDVDANTLVFGAQLEGDMLGTNYNAVGGEVLGRVIHNGTSQNFDGTFIAER